MWCKLAAFTLGCLAAAQAAGQCYTVYDGNNRVLYHGRESPVDMSRPLHETLPGRYPGGHLVFDNITDCNELRPLTPPVADRLDVAPAPAARKEITELHDPPLRVTREGQRLTIEALRDH